MSTIRSALRTSGAREPIYAGDIWNIPDFRLSFADIDDSTRTLHETRYVLVLQGDDHGDNYRCPTILVAPLSSNTSHKRTWEDILEQDETPLSAPSIVKLQLIQPVARGVFSDPGTYVGVVSDDALDRIMLHLLENLGVGE